MTSTDAITAAHFQCQLAPVGMLTGALMGVVKGVGRNKVFRARNSIDNHMSKSTQAEPADPFRLHHDGSSEHRLLASVVWRLTSLFTTLLN